jgi:hypothetical protein
VRFVPFTVLHRSGTVLVSRADGAEWLELDGIGEQVLIDLDQGCQLGQVQTKWSTSLGEQVDIAAFVDELATLGFVAAVDGEHSSSRITRTDAPVRRAWPWNTVLVTTGAIAGCAIWLVASDRSALPRGSDFLIPGIPLGLAVAIAIVTGIGLMTVHELAHLAAGRYYGLSPRLRLGRRGIWLVAETDLTEVRALDQTLQWRPVAAGPMADLLILGASTIVLFLTGAEAAIAPVARLVAATTLAQLLWQLQWYLRTDGYFLFSTLSGAATLQGTVWTWATHLIHSQPGAQRTLPRRERIAAQLYLLSLPGAFVATYLMWQWMLVPFVRELVTR